MHKVLQNLYDDHTSARLLLDAFERELEIFAAAGDPDYDVLAGALDYLCDYLHAVHHPLEDRIIERLRRRDRRAAARAEGLAQQHADLERLTHEVVAAFAAVRDDAIGPRDRFTESGRALLKAYRDHMDWEEARLFPAVEQALKADDWEAVCASGGCDATDPLRARTIETRFAALARSMRQTDTA